MALFSCCTLNGSITAVDRLCPASYCTPLAVPTPPLMLAAAERPALTPLHEQAFGLAYGNAAAANAYWADSGSSPGDMKNKQPCICAECLRCSVRLYFAAVCATRSELASLVRWHVGRSHCLEINHGFPTNYTRTS